MGVDQRAAAEAAVVSAVLDYFEGWFDGDARRMERARFILVYPSVRSRRTDERWTRRPLIG